jgi:hypothetical protein
MGSAKMATVYKASRIRFAAGSAIAVVFAPEIAALVGPDVIPAAHTVADPVQNCTANQTHGSVDLNCGPNQSVPPGAAPGAANGLASESGLTQQNETRRH